MKPQPRPSVSVASAEPRGFYELAKAHVETHGGTWFVIDKRAAAQAWRAWIAYFAWLDDQTFPRGRNAVIFRALERFTAPTAWPLEFDASAPPSPPPDQREESPAPDRRKQLAAMLQSVTAGMAPPPPRRAKPFEPPVAEARPLFDTPIAVSPAMVEYLERMKAAEAEELQF